MNSNYHSYLFLKASYLFVTVHQPEICNRGHWPDGTIKHTSVLPGSSVALNACAISRWCWYNIVIFISRRPPNSDCSIIFQCQLWRTYVSPLLKKCVLNLSDFKCGKEKGGVPQNSHRRCKKFKSCVLKTILFRYHFAKNGKVIWLFFPTYSQKNDI